MRLAGPCDFRAGPLRPVRLVATLRAAALVAGTAIKLRFGSGGLSRGHDEGSVPRGERERLVRRVGSGSPECSRALSSEDVDSQEQYARSPVRAGHASRGPQGRAT
jgi:hypothetical protein